MTEAFICDAIRTPIGRYGGGLSSIRTDDLGALPMRALCERNPEVDFSRVDDVIYGCANQAGEDNRNVARMSALLAGLPTDVSGATINRLCGSGLDAVGISARAIKCGEAHLMIAGGVESMSRAPFVMGKADSAFSRKAEIFDTTIGWRFINRALKQQFGTDSMPQTADNVAERFAISREDQDAFAWRSQQRWATAHAAGNFSDEIVPVSVPQRRGDALIVDTDEHPRPSVSMQKLSTLKGINGADLSVTAGNASGVNDGACALLLASEKFASEYGLTPKARVVASATCGVEPAIMGIGPAPACEKLLHLTGLGIQQMDIIELNEAFAAQGLAVMRRLGIADDADNVNAQGGAIAMGHPLGMSGARLVTTAVLQLHRSGGRYALCTMCIGVGQGIAMIIERV
ncbi:MAG: acetyl-CoA acyltransferase [Parasphingorhabdus sp.]|jgi:acetyl-CoA acyltransferase